MHLFSIHAWQAHIQPRQSFFAYNALNINFEGVNCSPCNFRGIAYFYEFFYVSQLSYKPSKFARANKPYATG